MFQPTDDDVGIEIEGTMNRLLGKSLVFVAALTLLPSAAVAANTSDDPHPEPPIVAVPGPADPTDVEKYLTLPAISVEQAAWMTEVQERLGVDPNFNSLAISEDRGSMTVTWFGAPSECLGELLSAAPADTAVEVVPSKFPGDKLRKLVAQAVERGQFDGSRVVSGFANNDGSGITLNVVSQGEETLRHAQVNIAEELGSSEIPVAVHHAASEVKPTRRERATNRSGQGVLFSSQSRVDAPASQ